MDFEILLAKNPWWKGKGYIEKDEDYRKWKEKKIKWTPKMLDAVGLKPFSLHFIFGPRQVGKTTLVKLLVKKLLEKNISPASIFYFRCDELRDYKELKEAVDAYMDFREREEIENSVILLDEITAPSEWWRTIKSMIDDGLFKKDVLILTGSASIEVKKEMEFFPGRRGYGKDFALLPLSFREFVEVVDSRLAEKLNKQQSKNVIYLTELNKLLSKYFQCGGFPLSINSYFENGRVEDSVKNTYLSWIKNDLMKAGRRVEIAREITKVLMAKMPSAVSWENIARETSIKSPKTVNSYIHTFSDLFIFIISHFIDPHSMVIQFGKNKKIHPIDPLLFHIFEDWCLIKLKEKESVIAESILASHLHRRFGEVFYWKNREEIDCVVREKEILKGYECKWRESAKEKRIWIGKIKKVHTISKKDADFKRNIVPLSLFLYSL
jgi:hypothetical protein